MVGDRRRGEVERVGGSSERAATGDLKEDADMV